MAENKDEQNYLKILLRQYSECWADIRHYNNQIWLMPSILIATISIVGILFHYWQDFQIGRVLSLLLAFGFTLIIMIALKKHRFFSNNRVKNYEKIQEQLKKLSGKIKNDFVEIKWKTPDLAENTSCINKTRAYNWQLGLIIIILIGISVLLLGELVLFICSIS